VVKINNLQVTGLDIDSVAKDMFQAMPKVSSELLYKIELDMASKIYGFFTAIGFMMILTILLFSM